MAKRPTKAPDPEGAPQLVRLNKLLADNGIASRRRADALIEAGEVMIDGEIVTELGTRVDPESQRVEVDGVVLRAAGERKRYYLLNKPAGVLCTNDERENRRRAIDLIDDRRKGRIYTVGRLDEETVGLVILTNDGAFAERVGHPRYEVPKTYKVVVEGRLGERELTKLREGVRLSDGWTKFLAVKPTRRTDKSSTVLLTLNEGRNREIRRAFVKLGHRVKSLARVRIAGITDRGLGVGQWRPLTRSEVTSLVEGDFPAPGELSPRGPAAGDRRSRHARPTRKGPSGRRGARRG